MNKKNKKKKVNAKRERYAKFKKEQPSIMTYNPPDLTPEQQKQKQEDERTIGLFWRYNKPRRVIKGIGAKKRK